MEGYLRLILLVIGAVIVFFILLEARKKRLQRQRGILGEENSHHSPDEVLGLIHVEPKLGDAETVAQAEQASVATKPTVIEDYKRDLLAITVAAKPGSEFASYDLFHAISAAGLQFGEMNIFHYYAFSENGKQSLFSLASANASGEFDLNRMGDFSCAGLDLFMHLNKVSNPQEAFDRLLKTADQLVEDLDGELRASMRTPLSVEILQQLHQKVSHFQQLKQA